MASNLPGFFVVKDTPFTLYNNRWDKGVTVNIIYQVKFWRWLWYFLLKRKPLYVNVITGNSGTVNINPLVQLGKKDPPAATASK